MVGIGLLRLCHPCSCSHSTNHTFVRNLFSAGRAIGILGAIPPAVTFVVSPLWGAWADKTGRYQQIMLYTFLGSVVARLATASWPDYRWLVATVLVAAALSAPVKPLMDSAEIGRAHV